MTEESTTKDGKTSKGWERPNKRRKGRPRKQPVEGLTDDLAQVLEKHGADAVIKAAKKKQKSEVEVSAKGWTDEVQAYFNRTAYLLRRHTAGHLHGFTMARVILSDHETHGGYALAPKLAAYSKVFAERYDMPSSSVRDLKNKEKRAEAVALGLIEFLTEDESSTKGVRARETHVCADNVRRNTFVTEREYCYVINIEMLEEMEAKRLADEAASARKCPVDGKPVTRGGATYCSPGCRLKAFRDEKKAASQAAGAEGYQVGETVNPDSASYRCTTSAQQEHAISLTLLNRSALDIAKEATSSSGQGKKADDDGGNSSAQGETPGGVGGPGSEDIPGDKEYTPAQVVAGLSKHFPKWDIQPNLLIARINEVAQAKGVPVRVVCHAAEWLAVSANLSCPDGGKPDWGVPRRMDKPGNEPAAWLSFILMPKNDPNGGAVSAYLDASRKKAAKLGVDPDEFVLLDWLIAQDTSEDEPAAQPEPRRLKRTGNRTVPKPPAGPKLDPAKVVAAGARIRAEHDAAS